MANKHQTQAVVLAALVAAVIITAVAARLLCFAPMENKYTVGGPEILFGQPAQPADSGLATIKEKLLKHPLYISLQKFGNWPPDFAQIKFLSSNPFVE